MWLVWIMGWGRKGKAKDRGKRTSFLIGEALSFKYADNRHDEEKKT